MATFKLVDTVREFPGDAATTGFVINTSEIRHAKQEYRSNGPIGVIDDEDFRILTADEAAEYYYATPVVHVWLKYDLRVFPILQKGEFDSEDKWDQIPKDRPTEIWIDGTIEDFFFLINEEDESAVAAIDDLNVQVDITVDGPVGGTNTWTLPVEWKGKRFRVFRDGIKFLNWTLTEADPQDILELSVSGDIWMGTDENAPGYEEKVSLENY